MPRTLKLGTRKSLLAWAQSSWVAREIERANPDFEVELVGIETRGDRIQNISLQAAAEMTGGKEFFVAEIDEALRSRTVDLTVHSMKDLSLDRPTEFAAAAIPPRENPRDVVLFGPAVLERLSQGRKLRIGTSSPRRLENIPPFLAKALPQLGRAPELEFVEIRGNVNTRLGRVHEPDSSERHLDGVVLAFAGLIRLWKDQSGREELKKLLRGVRWMVLPLRECPAAPAQGALMIECRRDNEAVLASIRKIHCEETESHVRLERGLLSDWGGGCHQKFGATAVSSGSLSKLLFIRGKKPDETFVSELRWQAPAAKPTGPKVIWDGSMWRAEATVEPISVSDEELSAPAVFIAHSRALPDSKAAALGESRVWTSGVASWQRLAVQGVWVEGCAENLGFEAIRRTLSEPVLQLPAPRDWRVLTHAGAQETSQTESGFPMTATYRLLGGYSSEAGEALGRATDIFWGSASQFDELKDKASPGARHACGAGKTVDRIASAGVQPLVFPSVEEWRKWINAD